MDTGEKVLTRKGPSERCAGGGGGCKAYLRRSTESFVRTARCRDVNRGWTEFYTADFVVADTPSSP
jgi:hypothetical protein